MKGVCRVCGCTENHPCHKKDGNPCHWVMDDLCDDCAIVTDTLYFKKLIIPKECCFCINLEKKYSKYRCSLGRYRIEAYGRSDTGFKWSGIFDPNMTVWTAQRKCPEFGIFPNFMHIKRKGRIEECLKKR